MAHFFDRKKLQKISLDRKIPTTMATQHPDNAAPPYWKGNHDPFISTLDEIEECYRSYIDIGCQEYMWDWEGKYVDEGVVEKLFSTHYDYFKDNQIGKDIFLTFRLPNIWYEKEYRIARAYIGILTFEDLARDLKLKTPPVFEVILPMTDEGQKMLYLQQTFRKIAKLKNQVFDEEGTVKDSSYLQVIPLVEGVSELTASRKILHDYVNLHDKEYGTKPLYLRPFIARSDPALNAGIVPATIAAKVALSEYYRFEEETGIPVFPIMGVGSLPFRGGLSPWNVPHFIEEYPGVRTVTVQSAFRYDYPQEDVREAITLLNRSLPGSVPLAYTPEEVNAGERLVEIFSEHYRKTIEEVADVVNRVSSRIPPRRERKLHIGLFGYSRGIGQKQLPRAIGFTASLYSLGIPPELIGTGRGIAQAIREGLGDHLSLFYRRLKDDMQDAGHFLNKENLEFLAAEDQTWMTVKEDIDLIEDFFKIRLGPVTIEHYLHRNFVSSIYFLMQEEKDFSEYLLNAAILRRSLG